MAYIEVTIINRLTSPTTYYYVVPTRIDTVPGVQQKLLSRRVPQVDNWLQSPPWAPHPLLLQKPTLLVADKQLVSGALRQVAPPLYTIQVPPQMPSTLMLQYVTIVFSALRLERLERSPRG